MKLRIITSTLLAAILTVTIPLTTFAAPASAYSDYVALGDSIASGAGLGANLDATCDRSSLAYPSLLARKLGTSVQNYACSGAKVDEGIYGAQERDGTDIVPQLDAAFEDGTPDLITMTIGANDIRWTSFLRDCYTYECGSGLDKARAVIYRADLRLELYIALQQIEYLSDGKPPTVLINGYYSPLSSADCDATAEISDAEAAWLAEQKYYLNRSLRTVISYFDFAEFVPVDFSSHKLCATDTWLQGADGAAPLHPNATGQQKLAEANIRVLNQLD
jgi:lysophospholipase L1-like esterase